MVIQKGKRKGEIRTLRRDEEGKAATAHAAITAIGWLSSTRAIYEAKPPELVYNAMQLGMSLMELCARVAVGEKGRGKRGNERLVAMIEDLIRHRRGGRGNEKRLMVKEVADHLVKCKPSEVTWSEDGARGWSGKI